MNKSNNIGNATTVIAASVVWAMIPAAGVVAALFGPRNFSRYESGTFYIMQGLVLLALVGSLISYRGHRKVLPLLLAIGSAAAIIYGINARLDVYYMFPGMVGLLVVSLWNSIETRRAEDPPEDGNQYTPA